MKQTKKADKDSDNVRICPRCGAHRVMYRPGIDIGMMHAICMNCGFEANQHLFLLVDKKDAKRMKVKPGKELDKLRIESMKSGRRKKILLLSAIVVFLIILFFMMY